MAAARAAERGWSVAWACLRQESTHVTLTGHSGPVLAVAATPSPGGRTLLASSGADGTVRVWDPVAGVPVGSPLSAHNGGVLAVVAVPGPGGRILLASGSDDATVRIWDPVARTCLAVLSLHMTVTALAPTGDRHLAVGTDSGVAVLDIVEVVRR
jgi:WD40 repeat protein